MTEENPWLVESGDALAMPAAGTAVVMLEDPPHAAEPAATAMARMLAYEGQHHVAFAPYATVEAIDTPVILPVPGMPYYAYGLIRWQEQWIPLIQLDSLIKAYPAGSMRTPPRYSLVLSYQTAPGEPIRQGAVAINDLPLPVPVSNDDACPLPDDSDLWQQIAISCFAYQGNPVPIIDTGKLFGSAHE